MSGGSMDYFFSHVRRVVEDEQFETNTPARRALAEHLMKLADVLHEVEWVDSGDRVAGNDEVMIRELLGSKAIAGMLTCQLVELIAEAQVEASHLAGKNAVRCVSCKKTALHDQIRSASRTTLEWPYTPSGRMHWHMDQPGFIVFPVEEISL